MDARRFENVVVIRLHVALVVDLHQHVAVVALEQPVGGVGHGAAHRGLVLHLLVLPEVEVADDRHHSQRIGLVEDAGEAIHIRRPQISVRFEWRYSPTAGSWSSPRGCRPAG